MAISKVLITVKTYPSISAKYDELVCTAGFNENGSWIRIYPIPFRKLDYNYQYKKYDWIELDLVKNTADFRPESFRPRSFDTEIKIVGHIGTEGNWKTRKDIILKKIYNNLATLIAEAKDRKIGTSLAVFKPTKILDFVFEKVSEDWDEAKLNSLQQCNLFEQRGDKIEIVRKLPYKFSFIFEDNEGRRSKLMIEDWETGMLYWNCIDKYGDENRACADVRKKYLEDFAMKKDLYFFLGTTKINHFRAPNPFIIIGTFHPKIESQFNLF